VGQLPITVGGDLGESPIHLSVTLLVRPDIPFVHFGLSLHQHLGAVLEGFWLLGVLEGVKVVLLVLLDFRYGIRDAPGLLFETFHVVSRFLTRLRVVLGEVQVEGRGAERLRTVVVILVFLLTLVVDCLRHLKLHAKVVQVPNA
jgi:hypothetical protein